MNFLRCVRNEFFDYAKEKRIYRILFCTWVIGMIWIFADLLSGSASVNIWHDMICLVLGVIAERLIPWGKAGEKEKVEELLVVNKKLEKELAQTNKKLGTLIDKVTRVKDKVGGKV